MNLSNHLLSSGARLKTLTYIGNTSDTTNTDVYTFSGHSIGAVAFDRRVHVLVMANGGTGAINSVTVGGVAATANEAPAGSDLAGIFTAAVPTGTTADIVVTFAAARQRCNIGVYRATGLTSNNAVDTGTSIADPATATLTALKWGYCLALVTNDANTTVSWTNVTEDYDTQVEATSVASGASITTSTTSISPSGNYAAGGTNRLGVFATF